MALYDPVPDSATKKAELDLAAAASRLGVTEEQAGNLLSLAEGLLSLPDGYGHFDMAVFFRQGRDYVYMVPGRMPDPSECGAVACAVGHAPVFCGVPSYPCEPWSVYAKRVLGVGMHSSSHRAVWDYLFDGLWYMRDNTSRGAGQRILRALRRGVPEKDYDGSPAYFEDYKKETL